MMNDSTVIQRLSLLVSIPASLSWYLGRIRVTRIHIKDTIGPWFLPPEFKLPQLTTLFRSPAHPGGERKPSAGGGAHKPADDGTSSSKNRLSIAGDWLAPAIVWLLVIMMGIAVVSFLLGQR